MTREEAKKIVMIVVTTYPNFKPNDLGFMVDVWTDMLSDYTYQEIAISLKSYIKSENGGFAPSIGQLINGLNTIKKIAISEKKMTEQEAWAKVYKAICNSNYNSEKEFNKLDYTIQRAVGNSTILREWAQTDIDSIQNVIASNFMRTFRAIQKQEEEESKIPKDVLDMFVAKGIGTTDRKLIGE